MNRTKTSLDLKELKPFLDGLFVKYHQREFTPSDPIGVALEFKDPQDQEIAAFVSAMFSYGSARQIVKALREIFKPFKNLRKDILKYNGENLWPGFTYRFHRASHLQALFLALGGVLEEKSSLENAAASHSKELLEGWNGFMLELRERTSKAIDLLKLDRASTWRGLRFLFNCTNEGAGACKRSMMFLRWVVRKDEIDLGLWCKFSPSQLIIPVDTHIARLSYYLRLRRGKEDAAPTWKMALEITENLRKLCPEDPTKYDFALTRLGILDICQRSYLKSVCESCPVAPGCRHYAYRN